MARKLYHGRGEDGLLNVAEEGIIKGSEVSEDEVFPKMSSEMNVYGKENAVWVTESQECAEVYAWGGGYLEIDPTGLKVAEDSDTCYAVIMGEEVSIDHVNRIMVERREGARDEPTRNLDLEIANLLDSEHQHIRVGSYQPKKYEVQ